MKRLILIAGILALSFACDNKGGDAAKDDAPGPAAEKIVKTDIPDDLQNEAKREVTAENVDAVAAELEKEIEADTP